MCHISTLSKIVYITYLSLVILIPLLYLISFALYKSKRKNYSKAFRNAFIIFLILFSLKAIAYFFKDSCFNCYMNNICLRDYKEEKKEDDIIKETTTTTTTTETTTTITTTSTTTTKKINTANNEFNKVAEIDGERKVIGTSNNGYEIYTINGVTYVDGYMIVNKTYGLSSDYRPTNTHTSTNGVTKHCANCIVNDAYNAWTVMKADALAVGFNLWIQSGYRPYELQTNLYNNYVKRDGKEKADTFSARPGNSEHQTGLCFDINNPSSSFNNTSEAKWIKENCYKYGFIIRYPENKTNETGYIYESWHVRYVGTDLSYKLYNNGDWITMENYFGLTSVYPEE